MLSINYHDPIFFFDKGWKNGKNVPWHILASDLKLRRSTDYWYLPLFISNILMIKSPVFSLINTGKINHLWLVTLWRVDIRHVKHKCPTLSKTHYILSFVSRYFLPHGKKLPAHIDMTWLVILVKVLNTTCGSQYLPVSISNTYKDETIAGSVFFFSI